MNKTISINLGGRNFFIEEQAFAKLDSYLSAIKAHFAKYPGSGEIVSDMENRMAEKFTEKSKDNPQAVITLSDVDNIVKELGTVEDLAAEEGDDKTHDNSDRDKDSYVPKRLFRNPDDKLIGGVCSGLAVYFDIDPTIVRLVFIALIFAWGTIIPIYIVLWIVVPEAKTPTEKMQMKGQPLNISSISQTIKEKAMEAKSSTKNFRSGLGRILEKIGGLVKALAYGLGKLAGLLVAMLSALLLSALTFIAAVSIFNIHSPYLDSSFKVLAQDPTYYLLVIAAYLGIFIPILFLLLLGVAIFRKRKAMSANFGFSLLGVWILIVIFGGVLALKNVPQYVDRIQSLPEYQTASKEFAVAGGYSKVDLHGINRYKLVQGDSFSVKASGKAAALERIKIQQNGDILRIDESARKQVCLFCDTGRSTIEITAPKFDTISGDGVVSINSDSLSASSTSINLSGASRANLHIKTDILTVKLDGVSSATLYGTANKLNANTTGTARLEAYELVADNAEISALGVSSARVNVTENLKHWTDPASHVYYIGNPKIDSSSNSRPARPEDPLEKEMMVE